MTLILSLDAGSLKIDSHGRASLHQRSGRKSTEQEVYQFYVSNPS
jgi:hypothetical protein